MVKRVQIVRHDPAGAAAFVGRVGEVTAETGTEQLRLHDGVTAGGKIIPNKTYVDAQDTATALLAIPKTIVNATDDIITGSGADAVQRVAVGASTILAKLAAGGLKAASPAELRILLSLVPGTDVQVEDAFLTAIAALGTAGAKLLKTTGVNTVAEISITAFGESLIDDANAAAGRATLALGALAVLDSVAAGQIDAGAVGTSEIAALAVTAAEIAANAVITAKINDNAVTLAKLAHGTAGKVIGFDGGGAPAELSAAVDTVGGLVSVQMIINPATTTWTKPAGVNLVVVECTGAGGGAGGSGGGSGFSGAGGGGGFSRELLAVTGNETIVIGAGGSGGTGSNSGTAGGTTSFRATPALQATGGGGGTGSSSPGQRASGAGGVGTLGDRNATGQGGQGLGIGGRPAGDIVNFSTSLSLVKGLGAPGVQGITNGFAGADGMIIVWEYK